MSLTDEAASVLTKIRPRRTGFYVPDPEGDWARTCPVFDVTNEQAIDIVAWFAGTPNIWWLRTGAGICLGEWELGFAKDYQIPVTVCATPQEWLEEGRYGDLLSVCVLRRSSVQAVLGHVQTRRKERRSAA